MKARKLLVLVLAAVAVVGCLTATAFAQETKQLTVNDGTTTNCNVPYSAYNVDTSGMRSQFLLDYADVEALWGNKITKMTFYVQSGNSVDATFDVRLKIVENSNIAGIAGGFIDTTDATVVYSGTFSIANGKIEIPFTNDFYYYQQSGFVHSLLVDISMTSTVRLNGDTYFYGVGISSPKTYVKYGSSFKNNQYFSPKVTFDYEVPTYLDLEASDVTYAESKVIDQNYTFTQTDEEYTDVTKVKLEWTISDIAATYKSHKTWDPDTLAWVEAKEDISAADQTATFKLTNYSSSDVQANVAFAAEESLKSTYDAENSTFDNNDCIVMTPVVRNTVTTYQDSDFAAKAQTITATMKFSADAFKALSAQDTAAKYGTYTVKIGEVKPNYLAFTANTAGSTVTPEFASGTYQYSTDNGATWLDGSNSGTTITLANVGDSVMLKGTNCVTNSSHYFSMTGSISASGSVTSLTDGLGANKDVTLSASCYSYMFKNCNVLTTAPELPAITLADNCYDSMFESCTALTQAPALPAKNLATACYKYMFYNCSALKSAPALSATTLAPSCYQYMFNKCTALEAAPELPAQNLAVSCYEDMFKGCSSLTKAPTLSAMNLTDSCYCSMFEDCKALETAPALPAKNLDEYCYYKMFAGCTALTKAPDLPAENLKYSCYYSMFSKCTALTTAPVISATTLASLSCYNMFGDCTGLTAATTLLANDLSVKCYKYTFDGCTSLKITTEKPVSGTEGTDWGVIFGGAKTVGTDAVASMFGNCVLGSGVSATPTIAEGTTYYWYK